MSQKDDNVFAKHILDNIYAVESFVGKFSKSELESDRLRQSAIIRELEVIGEAVKNLSEETKKKYPHIAWKQIAGMRDKLIHHYFGVDMNTVWGVLDKDLPELKEVIKKIVI